MSPAPTLEPPDTPGELRAGTADDFDRTMEWLGRFGDDTGSHAADAAAVEWRLAHGSMYFWECDGEPVALAGHALEVEGVTRVGPVYTPDEHRRQGYGAAVTSGVTQAALDKGARTTILYTQLSNPQSNAIYRRLGYRPVAELIGYRFGSLSP